MAVVGKSGSGKTTLLKCIYGLEDIKSGEVFLDGDRVLGPSFNLIPGHEDMKLVSQEFYVLDNHTVEENIFDKLIGFSNEYKQKRTNSLLKLLDLGYIKNTRAKYLSSGQKQRVAIARALAIIPKVLLLDEPFSNLDTLLTQKLFAFVIKEVKKNKTAVILITHLAEEALKYADSLLVLNNGALTEYGDKWQIYHHPESTRLAGLLGEFNILKKDDLHKQSKLQIKSKLFLRPDRIKLTRSQKKIDLELLIVNSGFNGKCFESLGETQTGNSILVYSDQKLGVDKKFYFSIEQPAY